MSVVDYCAVCLTVLAGEVGEHGDGLDGLAEAHLVGQDAVEFALVHGGQPLHAHVLVLTQLVLQQERHRRLHLITNNAIYVIVCRIAFFIICFLTLSSSGRIFI